MSIDSKYAIHEACREGKTNVVESLLNANPKLSSLRDEDDRLPLHWACTANSVPIVQLLLQQKPFDPDAADGLGWTPLMIACSLKDAPASPDSLISLILSRDADANLTNNAGQTALHFTVSKNNLDVARLLITQGNAKASVRKKDRRQQLPLHRAAAIGSIPMMKLLVENRSPVNATDIDGLTALHHAVSEGHGDAALWLLRQGAEWGKRDREDKRAVDLAPDAKVRNYILQTAEREGIEIE